ncbi:hypothetical protein K450DRAFT_234658 [Umbelopsis ramanniana AG]|uniref:SEC7 domain-containing protein n=1 Tax=Umbelopsis ramanniana AG TaxID=1314678 RepID=A0AAD5HGI3_UMBRA|nr:uncharacterized protein K450DRAFT_234658 [Umbelopsis ramanniana AG]KAI8581103.1 hypothetical protein K450DRAFT_234658 [Umbelopsis ramanniana AG]
MTDNPPTIDPSSLRSPQPSQHAASPLYGNDNLKCELTWSQLIHAEIIAVTSAMRKNSRWSGISVSGLHMGSLGMSMGLRTGLTSGKDGNYRNQESPLMHGFTSLRSYLTTVRDIYEIDASMLLNPFLDVIRSGNTTGPIAGAALSSVEKFLQYGIIGLSSPNIAIAMGNLASAATHCKFEASDSVSDEVVLLKMLQVLQMALICPCGSVLSDEAVCEMMETGLSMCCQMRLSEMLRRSAEHVMINMIIAMFERLKVINEIEDLDAENPTDVLQTIEEVQSGRSDPHMNTPKPSVSPSLPDAYTALDGNTASSSPRSISTPAAETVHTPSNETDANNVSEPNARNVVDVGLNVTTQENVEDGVEEIDIIPIPYGLPAIRELLRVLISLLNPHEHKHTDSMRLMALSILNVAFDVGGKSISRFESLRNLITDEFCKYLFQLAKTDSIPLLTLTLRVISTVFDTMRPYLKLQQELFLFFLIERLTRTGSTSTGITYNVDEEGSVNFVLPNLDTTRDGRDSGYVDVRSSSPGLGGRSSDSRSVKSGNESSAYSGEVRELLLECLTQCARIPTFMVDLWVNFDSDISCGNLFEELIHFLSKNSFPEPNSYSASNSHMLCLDTLLLFINHMVDRISDEEDDFTNDPTHLPPSALLERKEQKHILLEGASRFNDSPKKGIKYLKEQGVIVEDEKGDFTDSLAHFLMSTPKLNKKSLGEYLGRPDNVPLLQRFMRQFDFSNKRVDEALRVLLETFRLPGESQQIDRITETFADAFMESKPAEVANAEAAYVLAFSVIMLNTDQHNRQVRHRMSFDQYKSNVRGLNAGKDFDREYLQSIYDAIRSDEIVMPEEHEGQLGFNFAWKQLLHHAKSAGLFTVCDTAAYDKDIFMLAWKPAVAAISYAFNTAQDDITLQKAITGFHQCALLSAHYQLHDVFDSIIVSLASMTGLVDMEDTLLTAPDPIVDVAGQKYVISRLAVRFGRNYKGQLAAVVAFAVASEHGSVLRKGWIKILRMIKNLFVNSLLPSSMLQVEDFLLGTTVIPLKPKSSTPPKQQARKDASLLSTLSSYLLSPYSGDESYRADPTEDEVESTMCAVDCVVACRLEELFANIQYLDKEPLEYLMKAIRTIGYKTVIDESTTPIVYDPATVFFLELMISITIQNIERMDELWPYMYGYIAGILEKAENQSVLLLERTVVGLLRVCICVADKPSMQNELDKCFKLLLNLPNTVLQAVGEQTMAGILNLLKLNSTQVSKSWESILDLVQATVGHADASNYGFESAVYILSADNGAKLNSAQFAKLVSIFGTFAAVAAPIPQAKESPIRNRSAPSHKVKTPQLSIERGKKAIEHLFQLHRIIPQLSQDVASEETWTTYWQPILTTLSQQCCTACREVRQHSMTYLQRTVLLPDIARADVGEEGERVPWVNMFDNVLIPLLSELLRPQVYELDPLGTDEARMRASTLLCKIFLHYCSRMIEMTAFIDIWMEILDILDGSMHTSENDHLAEAVRESLKNMLLVMYTSGAFTVIPPHDLPADTPPEYNHLWDITWERLDGFMPNLKSELFPAPAPEPQVIANNEEQPQPQESQQDIPPSEDNDNSDIIDATSTVQAI